MYHRIYPLFNGSFSILFKSVPAMENIRCFAFLVVGEDGEMLLVDTGFSPAYIPGLQTDFKRSSEHEITNAIDKLGFNPLDVKQVVMTHLHWDHTAGMNDFAQARFFIQADDFRGLLQLNPNEETYYCPTHWFNLLPQVEMVDGDLEIKPGIKLIYNGGHTRGHQLVEVQTRSGPVVLAGDSPFNYDLLWEMISPEGWRLFREGPGKRFYWDDSILPGIRNHLEQRGKLGPVKGQAIPWKDLKKRGTRLITSHDPRNLKISCID
jgi:glyoxylase-like metal-dependent hydrolase (beta-lactamase superfamily II)